MSYQTVRGFFLAAPMIYSAILRLAASAASPAQISDLKDAQHRFRAALAENNVAARTLANHRFHRITGEMAGNVYLLPSFHRLLIDHARIGMSFFRQHRPSEGNMLEEAARQHDAMIAAVEARDGDAAAALAEAHWALSREQISRFVMPESLETIGAQAP